MKIKVLSSDELNNISKDAIILIYQQLAESFAIIQDQNEHLIKQVDKLQESISLLTQQRFGRKTEKTKEIINGQLCFDKNGHIIIPSNTDPDASDVDDDCKSEEELIVEYLARREARKRKKGVRSQDLAFADVIIEEHELDEEELSNHFPDGYRELPCEISHRVEYEPSKLTVIEEKVHIYKSKSDDSIIRADKPDHLMAHSVVTPSLLSKIITDKYVNAMPVNRIFKDFERMDVILRPQTMNRWLIKLSMTYIKPLVLRMKDTMISLADLIHCDETPFVVEEDHKRKGKSKESKSYMWVYHTFDRYGAPPIFIYEYQPDRKGEHPKEFLKGYSGVIVTDGYEPYHSIEKERDGDIIVAGCWAHLKRKLAAIIKADPENAKGTVAYEGNAKIAAIFHMDNMLKDAKPSDRLRHRKSNVAPLVDAFFEWVKDRDGKVASDATQRALTYAINQEHYLRAFLDNGMIPMDNSDAERSIRSFCIGRNNWNIVASSDGAEVAGYLYSMVETLKACRIKPYEYFKYVFETMLANENNITLELIDSLMPWSKEIPEEFYIKDTKKRTKTK